MPEFILSAEEMDQLDVRVTGDGGFQSLMRRFQGDPSEGVGQIQTKALPSRQPLYIIP